MAQLLNLQVILDIRRHIQFQFRFQFDLRLQFGPQFIHLPLQSLQIVNALLFLRLQIGRQLFMNEIQLLGPDVLVIDAFGQADFMGGYTIWGYENYLAAAALYPEAMRHYYHHTALRGRLLNQAILLAWPGAEVAPLGITHQ